MLSKSIERERKLLFGFGSGIVAAFAINALFVFIIGKKFSVLTQDAWAKSDFLDLGRIGLLYGALFLLLFCIAVHQIAAFAFSRGAINRLRKPKLPSPPGEDLFHSGALSELLILVPSFKEDYDVIKQTLISAALVAHPRRRVVLLIDDPCPARNDADAKTLAASRRLPIELQMLFDSAASLFEKELSDFESRKWQGLCMLPEEVTRLASLYRSAAAWLEEFAEKYLCSRPAGGTHTDRLFTQKIILEPAVKHRRQAQALQESSLAALAERTIEQEYRNLASLFKVEFASFERKRFVNLSHAPNKAMNINSYLALLGGSFREVGRPGGRWLEKCSEEEASLRVPPAEYILTVDADSLVVSEYAIESIGMMARRENELIAIAQSPYTAVPDAPIALERAAASSTDAQFFNHQGMEHLGASWWVGASALMRHSALEDIATEIEERGHQIKVYIDDKILIEDAAATIDLRAKGWRVHHSPIRLAYSATPDNFGALVIQRRRWANGGLLIFPKMLSRHSLRWPLSPARIGEALLRTPNLLAPTIAGIIMPLVLFYRFEDRLIPPWIALAVLPYFFVHAFELVMAGYRWTYTLQVYALNMLLIPVNFVGTWQSLRQAWSGRPIPFKRTPKISSVTVPLSYIVASAVMCGYALFACVNDLIDDRFAHALFSSANFAALAYGLAGLIGFSTIFRSVREEFGRFWSGPTSEQPHGELQTNPDALQAIRPERSESMTYDAFKERLDA